MYPIAVVGTSQIVPPGASVAATVNGASFVLVSNENATWADFAFTSSTASPAVPTNPDGSALTGSALLPVPPNGQLLVRCPAKEQFWGSLTGGVTVTPVEVRY